MELLLRILDPIHKYITFSDYEESLIDSVMFQRLRYIRQLGFAEYAFPGAIHSRFLHSLGVCHLAGRAFDSLRLLDDLLSPQKKKTFRQVVRLAALLHDIGHGPLSHISETAMPCLSGLSLPYLASNQSYRKAKTTHEHYTIKLILESELKNLIKAIGVDPEYVAHLIDDRIPIPDNNFFISKGIDFKPLLKQIISSDLDMDRMDYLQRDSFFCGTDYGFCDHEWILNNLQVYIHKDQAFMGVGQKAVYSVESFFLGRRHMGLAVYFHNKMVAMDEMLCHYFDSSDCDFYIPTSLKDYIQCTDLSLFENLKSHVHNNEWACRIIEKKPYERIYEIQYVYSEKDVRLEKFQEVVLLLKKKGVPFIHTNSLAHTEKLYFAQSESRFPVYIVDESTGFAVSLRERMKMFNQKEHVLLMDRLYIPPEDRRKIYKDIAKMTEINHSLFL